MGVIVALALSICALVSSEFLPASVLPTLADDIGVSEGTAGLAVAATAIAGAISAPSVGVVLPRMDRRTLLVTMLMLGTLSNLIVALTPSFAVLLVGRLIVGIAISGLWAFAFTVGTYAVPGRERAVSTGVSFGVSIATVAGVPIGSVVGEAVGWRASFLGAAVVTAVAAVVLRRSLPPVPAAPGAGLAMLRQALRNRRLMAGIGLVVFVAFANFAAYPYIKIAADRVEPGNASWLLLVWGAGAVAGTIVAGVAAVRLRALAATAPALLAVGLFFVATTDSLPVMVAAILVWGFAFNMVPVATQLWVTQVESERAESALSLGVLAFQIAITAGAIVGGQMLDAHGVQVPLLAGTVAAIVGALGFAAIRIPRVR